MVTATNSNIVEIEIDGPNNEHWYFPEEGKRIRGRLDFVRMPEPDSKTKQNDWPAPIPGQRVRLDLETGEGAIVEPLYDPEHAETRRLIEDRSMRLPEQEELFPAAHVPTWLFHMRTAVDIGLAKLVRGKFPAKLGGKPHREFITQSTPDITERLAESLQQVVEQGREQTTALMEAIKQNTAAIAAMLQQQNQRK